MAFKAHSASRIENYASDERASRYDNEVIVGFSKTDLIDFVTIRSRNVTHKSAKRIENIASDIWEHTQGIISRQTLTNLTDYYINRYNSDSALSKCFNYSRAFITHLSKIRMQQSILAFLPFIEKPKIAKERKMLTSRIIIDSDIQRLVRAIDNSTLPDPKKLNYKTFTLFLAYTGQRPETAARITVKQVRDALKQDPPVLTVKASQDKIRLEHYVPLHPVIIPFLQKIIEKRKDTETFFQHEYFSRWLKKNSISLSKTDDKILIKDMRKFFEQKSDEIGFTDANKNFIMSHGVSSINWQSYKQFLPENVYKRYMECWGKVSFEQDLSYPLVP